MHGSIRSLIIVAVCCACQPLILGQEAPSPNLNLVSQARTANAVAAVVNGQSIAEVAVERGLKRLPKERQAEARTEILEFLIENVLVDQHLKQMRFEISDKELDSRIEQIRGELKKNNQSFDNMLKELELNETELREQLAAELRWEKYCQTAVTTQQLEEFSAKNVEMFDGSMVRARHILVTPPGRDAASAEKAKSRLEQIKLQIEEDVKKELARLPAGTDKLARENARSRALEDAFTVHAGKESACPSREKGGDLGWFPRAGSMVEPFAQAAFQLKPYELSEVVATPFGYHLILSTGYRAGKKPAFDEVKEAVREVYCERLRVKMLSDLKPKARIEYPKP